jgi:hypothetical protein
VHLLAVQVGEDAVLTVLAVSQRLPADRHALPAATGRRGEALAGVLGLALEVEQLARLALTVLRPGMLGLGRVVLLLRRLERSAERVDIGLRGVLRGLLDGLTRRVERGGRLDELLPELDE